MPDDQTDAAQNTDQYDLSGNRDPYNLSTGRDPYDLSNGRDPYNISSDSRDNQSNATQGNGSSGSSGSGPSSKDNIRSDGLPVFDDKKSYLLKGVTLNRILSVIRRNRPRAVSGGGFRIAQQTTDGTFGAIDADELTLDVCINGVATSKTFYVKRSASG